MDKAKVMTLLRARIVDELETMVAAQRNTAAGVTHEESRAESDKDMRSVETSYLARGQAERVVDLRDGLARLEGLTLRAFAEDTPVALGALVRLEGDEGERLYFLAPAGGGEPLEIDGEGLRVVTPSSPVGRALIGRVVGDDVELRTPQGKSLWSLVEVG
jgi:transcription elongation GreA/GreB family factor